MAEYYLPAGTWTNFFTGEKVEGGKWISEKHGYLSIPLMVKENSIVALGARDDAPDYDYADGAELRIYELKEGETVTKSVYSMKQEEELKITAVKLNGTITLDVQSDKTYTVRLVNVTSVSVEGATAQTEGNDTILIPNGSHIVVKL